jgi:hypothetical protein
MLLAVNVHPANIMDRDGIKLVLDASTCPRSPLPRMELLWLDAGYNGRGKGKDWVERTLGWRVETVKAVHRFKRSWVPNDIPPDQIDWSHSQYWPAPGSTSFHGAGWWKGPSHSAYNPLLTSKCLPPMIGHTGLLNLLAVVTRLQAAQQDCTQAPREAGASCLRPLPARASGERSPRPRGHPCAVAGTACRQPIGTSSCVCLVVASNGS